MKQRHHRCTVQDEPQTITKAVTHIRLEATNVGKLAALDDLADKVAEVAITYEDRLTRFGQEYLEMLFACFGVTLTVLEPGEEKTEDAELTDDLLALIASFSGRLYGRRFHKQKELLQCATVVLTSP